MGDNSEGSEVIVNLIFFTNKLSLYMHDDILLYKQELPDRVNTLLEMIKI